jgi:CRP/FNR family transcriptional regulator
MDDSVLQLVKQHFPQLAEKQLQEEIAQFGKIYHFKANETIMDFGKYIKLVPLLLEGSIRVLRENEEGKEILLYYLKSGESCSMSFTCCMMNKQSIIRTVAEEDSTLIGIPIKYMDEWMRRYQSWKNFVMVSYDNRMLELVKVIDSIAFSQMDKRLWEYLQKKSSATQSKTIQTTHQEIANDLNASREAISRLLKQLEKMGKIQLSRNQIKLH